MKDIIFVTYFIAISNILQGSRGETLEMAAPIGKQLATLGGGCFW